MRPIEEIISELRNHPDCINYCIYTYSELIELINDGLDDDTVKLEMSDLSDELKSTIENHVENVMYEYTKFTSSPYPNLVRDNETNEWEVEEEYF
jgi:hypothetical protein